MNATITPVALPHGLTLPVAEQGDGRGVPVMLIHGFSDSWRSFEPLFPYLPSSIRAAAGSRLAVYRGAGHGLHWQEPRGVATNLLDLVGRVSG